MKYTVTVEISTSYEVTIEPWDFKEGVDFETAAVELVYGANENEDFPNCKVEFIEEWEKVFTDGPRYDTEN